MSKNFYTGQTLTANFAEIHGNNNNITGNDNVIVGDNNIIRGDRNYICGNGNNICGRENRWTGQNSIASPFVISSNYVGTLAPTYPGSTFVSATSQIWPSQPNVPISQPPIVPQQQQFMYVPQKSIIPQQIPSNPFVPLDMPKHVPDDIVPKEEAEQKISDVNHPNICTICYEREVKTVFLECFHSTTCIQCSRDIMLNGDKLCPICRKAIIKVKKLFK